MHKRRRKFYWLIALYLAPTGATAVGAQPGDIVADAVLIPQTFHESYDPTSSAVAGSEVAGIFIGPKPVAMGDISVTVAGPSGSQGPICLAAITRDGRFRSSGRYRRDPKQLGVRSLRIQPIAVQYAHQMMKYTPADMAVLAFVADDDDCRPGEALHLPQLFGPQGPDDHKLTLLVNGRSRSAVAKLVGEEPGAAHATEVRCREAGESGRIAFDLRCEVPVTLTDSARQVVVELTFDDGFGTQSRRVRTLVPAAR